MSPVTLEQLLGKKVTPEDLAVVPVAGVEFPAGSFIASWEAGVYHRFMTEDDYLIENRDREDDDQIPAPDLRDKRKDWFVHYYVDYAIAQEALEAMDPGNEYGTNEVWVIHAPTDTVLNRSAEALAKMKESFGDRILYEVRMMSLRGGSRQYPQRNRHHWQLITLPGSVAAIATAFGLSNAGFDFSELTAAEHESFTDESFAEYAGQVEGNYDASVLFKRRVALWESLGEEDPKKDSAIGSVTAKGKPSPGATASEALSQCLALMQVQWTQPIWCRVVTARNPYFDVNDKQPRNLPVIQDVYEDRATALAAANEELAERGQESGAGSVSSDIPVDWAGSPAEDWLAYVEANDDPKVTESSPPPKKAELVGKLFAENFDQIAAARDKIAKGKSNSG